MSPDTDAPKGQNATDETPITVVQNADVIAIDIGGCAGVFVTHNAKGEKSFHFSRVLACATLSDCVLHEPSGRIVAVRSHAAHLIPDILSAHTRWVGSNPEVVP